MNDSLLYAEQLSHELEARFASPGFQQRVSYFGSLRARLRRQPRRERSVTVPQRHQEQVCLPF